MFVTEPQSVTRRQALQLTSTAAVLFALPQGALAAAKGIATLLGIIEE